MKSKFFIRSGIFSVIVSLIAILPTHSADVSIQEGDSRDTVISALGRPTGSVSSDNEETLWFKNGTVKLKDNKVVSAEIQSDEAVARKEQDEQKATDQYKQQESLNKKILDERHARDKKVSEEISAVKAKEATERQIAINIQELNKLVRSFDDSMATFRENGNKWKIIFMSNKNYDEHLVVASQRRALRKICKLQLALCEQKLPIIESFLEKHPEIKQRDVDFDAVKSKIRLGSYKAAVDILTTLDDDIERWIVDTSRNIDKIYERLAENMRNSYENSLRQQQADCLSDQLRSINNKLDQIRQTQQWGF